MFVEKRLCSNEISFISSNRAGSNPHPIHIHGYTPQLVKVGYPTYNDDGTFKSSNTDITCENGRCQSREEARAFWANDGPLKARKDAPYKDTIIVPTGGYVVLRFKTDNPGGLECPCGIKQNHSDWHCHVFNWLVCARVVRVPLWDTIKSLVLVFSYI